MRANWIIVVLILSFIGCRRPPADAPPPVPETAPADRLPPVQKQTGVNVEGPLGAIQVDVAPQPGGPTEVRVNVDRTPSSP
jgi:hypothetical protein